MAALIGETGLIEGAIDKDIIKKLNEQGTVEPTAPVPTAEPVPTTTVEPTAPIEPSAPSAPSAPAPPPVPPVEATSVPTAPKPSIEPGPGANPFVTEGEAVQDVVGESTFARPGTRAFQPFAGRAFARNLRAPGEQVSMQLDNDLSAAGERGDLSRVFSGGSGGGTLGDALGGGRDRDQLLEEVLGRMGLK